MMLQRVAIQHFRKFTQPLVLDHLTPGLNLLCGPNEAGKSTIADAIRMVFLERYKVGGLQGIVPHTQSDGVPLIEVSFEIGGVSYELSKQFVKRQRCRLRVGSTIYDGDEAEAVLSGVIGFVRTERGVSRPENAGIPGLLWVRQGQTGAIREAGEFASAQLRDALASLTAGQMVGGDDALIRLVQGDLFSLLTERTRRATGPLATVESDLEKLRSTLAQLEAQNREFDDELLRLVRQQSEYDENDRSRPWLVLQEKADAASARVNEVAALERESDEISQKRQVIEAERQALLSQEEWALALEAAARIDDAALLPANEEAAQAQVAYDQATSTLTQAQSSSQTAQTRMAQAVAAEQHVALSAQCERLHRDIERINAALANAISNDEVRQALAHQAAQCEIDAKQLTQLRRLTEQMTPLQARRDAALTRIEYRLTRAVGIDSASITGNGSVLLDGEKTLDFPNFGTLRIVPGVSDMAELEAKLSSLDASCVALLSDLGIADYTAGVERLARWQALCAQRDSQTKIVQAHAPNGLDQLRIELARAQEQWTTTLARRDALETCEDAIRPEDAKVAVDDAVIAVEQARTLLFEASERKTRASAASAAIRMRIDSQQAQLSAPDFVALRRQRQSSLVDKAAHLDTYNRSLASLAERLEAARRDDPRDEVERYRKSATFAQDAQRERQRAIATLRVRLETLGALGLGEKLAQTRASIEQAEVRQAELRLRAEALSLLERVLVEERDRAVATLRQPLTERVAHYMRWLFPAGQIQVDEALAPLGLMRGNAVESLDVLSYGTQEQLGILARLAYADLLQAAGKPTLLLFDDALVHTDDHRREGIKRALLDAATRHQTIVLTCHPALWSDLGVKPRYIDELAAASR